MFVRKKVFNKLKLEFERLQKHINQKESSKFLESLVGDESKILSIQVTGDPHSELSVGYCGDKPMVSFRYEAIEYNGYGHKDVLVYKLEQMLSVFKSIKKEVCSKKKGK